MAKYRIDLDCDKIAGLYLSGKATREIGKILGVSQKPILLRLKNLGIEIRGGGKTRNITGRMNLDCDKIANLYLSGKTAKEIGKIFGVSKNPILHQLRKSGIQIRSKGHNWQKIWPTCCSSSRRKKKGP